MSAQSRQTYRYEVEIPVTARVGDATHEWIIRNLSLGGAYLLTQKRFSMETHLELSFRIPNQPQPIAVGARVRWSNEEGIGVQFDGLRAREVWSLNKFFEQL